MTTKMNARRELQLIKKLGQLRKEIAYRRDRLSEIMGEYESLIDSCDRAEDGLEKAINALSEYV